jgi:hypothetical protein
MKILVKTFTSNVSKRDSYVVRKGELKIRLPNASGSYLVRQISEKLLNKVAHDSDYIGFGKKDYETLITIGAYRRGDKDRPMSAEKYFELNSNQPTKQKFPSPKVSNVSKKYYFTYIDEDNFNVDNPSVSGPYNSAKDREKAINGILARERSEHTDFEVVDRYEK